MPSLRLLVIAYVFAASFGLAPSAQGSNGCGEIELSSPLQDKLIVESSFGLQRASSRFHKGVDYASNGASVLAVADGVVSKIGWNLKQIEHPDARTGLSVTGWGRYVVITHSDGSQSLYAHLEKDSTSALAVGASVKRGEVIGKSAISGGATGPHLHLEYAPKGDVTRTSDRVDPDKCIGRKVVKAR